MWSTKSLLWRLRPGAYDVHQQAAKLRHVVCQGSVCLRSQRTPASGCAESCPVADNGCLRTMGVSNFRCLQVATMAATAADVLTDVLNDHSSPYADVRCPGSSVYVTMSSLLQLPQRTEASPASTAQSQMHATQGWQMCPLRCVDILLVSCCIVFAAVQPGAAAGHQGRARAGGVWAGAGEGVCAVRAAQLRVVGGPAAGRRRGGAEGGRWCPGFWGGVGALGRPRAASCGWGRVLEPRAGLGLRLAISSAHDRSGSGVHCWPVGQQQKRAAAQSMRTASHSNASV